MTLVICPYCEEEAPLTHTREIYGVDFGWAYRCEPCDAYVGCHPKSKKPLGTLANSELRMCRMKAHEAFDPIWLYKSLQRQRAYDWLAKELGIEPKQCHIGMFNIAQCILATEVCERRRRDNE